METILYLKVFLLRHSDLVNLIGLIINLWLVITVVKLNLNYRRTHKAVFKYAPTYRYPAFHPPTYATDGSGAFDIRAQRMMQISTIPTKFGLGFSAEVPKGHVALLLVRSGHGNNDGMYMRNPVGVIDEDYRGEWMATLSLDNFSNTRGYLDHGRSPTAIKQFNPSERIMQVLIVPRAHIKKFKEVDKLSSTDRGDGGYGSTGTK